ncbi:hypothetical protein D3C86_1218860 [compost metagenome]
MQPQWSTGQDGVDLPGVAGDGFGTLGGRRGQYQVEALMFEDRQVIIDGFNQYQNGYRHAWLPVGIGKTARTSLEIADFRIAWQPPAMVVNDNACEPDKRGALESIASRLAPTVSAWARSVVGAGLAAMVVNDGAGERDERGALESIASRLAPTVFRECVKDLLFRC